MSTPVFNNGLFLREAVVKVGSHLDSFHLKNMIGDSEPTDMGPVDLWINASKTATPLYSLSSFNGKNVKYVDNPKGEYKWQTPVINDLPVMDDLDPSNVRKGDDGQSFMIKANKRTFSHGQVITYDKMNGAQLYITDDDIIPLGDGVGYTVKIKNSDDFKFLDNKFLDGKTKWFALTSDIGEYGQRYAEVFVEGGYREYYNFVGNSDAHRSYTISSKAELMMRGGVKGDQTMLVNEIWNLHDKSVLDPSIVSIEGLANKMGKDWMKKALGDGTLSRSFVTKLEAACFRAIIADNENDLMWGRGGIIETAGPETLRSSIGLWKALDNGFKRVYNKGTFSLKMFKYDISNFYKGKVDLEGPDPATTIYVQTGKGGLQQASEAIKKEALGQGLMTQSTEIGAISKQNTNMTLHYGYNFTSFTIPYLANVVFVYNPALDAEFANDIENPMIDGYRLSSYSYIVFDITQGEESNIQLMRKKWDHELRWWYINGKFDYKGQNGHQSSGGNFGYIVQMQKPKDSIRITDPTKCMKMVMRNPYTGGTL